MTELTPLRPNPSINPHIIRPTRLQVRIHEHAWPRSIVIDEEMVDLVRAVAAEVVLESHIGTSKRVEDTLLRIRRADEVEVVEEGCYAVGGDVAVRQGFHLILGATG